MAALGRNCGPTPPRAIFAAWSGRSSTPEPFQRPCRRVWIPVGGRVRAAGVSTKAGQRWRRGREESGCRGQGAVTETTGPHSERASIRRAVEKIAIPSAVRRPPSPDARADRCRPLPICPCGAAAPLPWRAPPAAPGAVACWCRSPACPGRACAIAASSSGTSPALRTGSDARSSSSAVSCADLRL